MCSSVRPIPPHPRRHPFRFPIALSLVLAALLGVVSPTQAQQTLLINTVAGPRGLHAYRPNSVAVASNGTVYMSDPTHNSVFRVATDGTLLPFAGPGEGQAGFGGDGGQAAAAQLGGPSGLAVVSDGSLYIADRLNHRIRKVDGTTGIITTVAGDGTSGDSGDNGQATAAQLNQPIGVAVTSDGTLYIADAFNHRIRKVDGATGIITTLAGDGTGAYGGDNGPATDAQLFYPTGVAVASDGTVYIADWNNHRVRRVASTGTITTLAGDGTGGHSGDNGQADAAQLNNPYGVLVTADGNTVYIADWNNHRIRKVDVSIATPTITTVAGTGTQGSGGDGGQATEADLNWPTGVAIDTVGNLYIAFNGTNRQGGVRKVDTAGIITTLTGGVFPGFSGDGGQATKARLRGPTDVVVDRAGNLYIADRANYRIRKVDTAGIITTVAGGHETCDMSDPPQCTVQGFSGDGGPATAAQLSLPMGVALTADGSTLYIADEHNHRIRKVVLATGVITTVAGSGTSNDENAGGFSGDGGDATMALLNNPQDVAVDSAGNLYIADTENNRIRKVVAATGIITTVVGTGTFGYGGDGGQATAAQLGTPIAVAVDAGDNLYIADASNHRIRKVTAATGIITTVAGGHETCDMNDPPQCTVEGFSGDGSPATAAQLNFPQGVAVARDGTVYIADTNNERIRKVATNGVITTIAGGVFCTNPADDRTCVDHGFRGDGGPAAIGWFNGPLGIALASNGAVYISDLFNHRVRVLALPPPPPRRGGGGGGSSRRRDAHGNTAGQATSIAPTSSTAGEIAPARDRDYFQFDAPHAGILVVETTGSTNTVGTVWLDGVQLATATEGGSRNNFRLGVPVQPGSVVIAVQGAGRATGRYALRTTFVAGQLENPGPTSFQSGLGVLSGWVCDADIVEIEINGQPQPAGYGTARGDTQAACGDTNNGFGLLFNWNLLGDGNHSVVALVDGIELARATVAVTTLGQEFLRDVEGTCALADFPTPGETVTLRWQEASQNFVLTDGAEPAADRPPPSAQEPAGQGRLENPGPGSFQSGIGVLSGWVCATDAVTIELNGTTQPAAYGTARGDTQAACGDSDNGFGLLFNWNLLGDGDHEVSAWADDEELGRATVRVTTLGEEFVPDARGTCRVEDFPEPGQTVTLTWQTAQQNFVITAVE